MFIRGVLSKVPHARLNGHPEKRLPNNINISAAYVEGEALVLSLDMEGVACSTGSACTSESLEPSHVLKAIGLPHELAHGSVRFTLGRQTKREEIDYVTGILPGIIERLRSISPLYKRSNMGTFNNRNLQDHYSNPRNAGYLEDADAVGCSRQPRQRGYNAALS